MKRLINTAFVTLMALAALGQDVEFKVSAPNVVAVGEQFRIVFTLNSRPQEFVPPSFSNFYVLAGPSISQNFSSEYINGKFTQNSSFTYTYILEATTEGKFVIESAKATISKKNYQSEPYAIEVVKPGGGQSRSEQSANQTSGNESTDELEETYLSTEIDRSTAFRGQPILVTLKIYTRQNVAGFEEFKFPQFVGFWNQEVETPNNIQFQRKNLNGRIYNEGVLRKFLLFPQQTGEITIDPFESIVLLQQRAGRNQSLFDDIFGMYQTVRKRMVSKPLKIRIKDLPANAPASFNGAVGRFNMEVSADKPELKTNEAVTLKVRISGSGNIRLIEAPKIQFPSGFETFDPKVNESISTTSEGAKGFKAIDYVAIPRTPGNYSIERVEFSYFDPVQEKYVTLKSKPLSFTIEADGSQPQGMQMVGFGKEEVKFIGKDIRYIITSVPKFTMGWGNFYGSSSYWLLLLLVIALAIVIFVFIKNRRQYMGNIALVRTRRANKVARKRLAFAYEYMKAQNSDRFYDELLRCMWGYTADKLNIPLAVLGSESAKETLIDHNVAEEDVAEFLRIVAECEYARYAPGSTQAQMDGLYQSAHSLVSKLEDIIKR